MGLPGRRAALVVYICVSTYILPEVSGLPASDEKKTAESTARNSVLTPIFSQPSLTICCVFWRTALTVVRKTTDICLPPFSR